MKKLTFITALILAGCSTLPKDPQQSLFVTEAGYAASLALAVQYHNLPPCDGSTPVCSDEFVMARLVNADDAAKAAFVKAEAAVSDPKADVNSVQTALLAAQAAAGAFAAITSTLKVQ